MQADRGDPWLQFANPLQPMRSILRHRELLWQLARREIVGRYRGSYLGILWALITPLMTLGVFTLVFGAIHGNIWPGSARPGVLDFAVNIFIGIVIYGVFSDCTGRASGLVSNNPNFVKKAVFPLELLAISDVTAAVAHSLLAMVIELLAVLLATGHLPATALLLPLLYVPVILFTVGICWLLAALGVFFRDLQNAVGPAVQLLFFLTPIVYPMAAVATKYPQAGRALRMFNPFVVIVESARLLLIAGQAPDWWALAGVTGGSAVVAAVGYIFFMKLRRYFADAL